MLTEIPYLAVVALVATGLYIIMFKKNLIKLAMGITLVEAGVNLFLITLAYRSGDRLAAPVFTNQLFGDATYSLPTPHALTLTSIVIGVATTALLLAFIMQVYRKLGVTSTDELRRLRG
jgi:multicomponent Na+:H+ antiporter subunit C